MEQLVLDLAEEGNLDAGAVEGALGILMGYLLDTVRDSTSRKIQAAIPELHALGVPHRQPKSFFGALLGGNAALLALPGKLARIGIGKEHMKLLAPRVGAYLKQHCDEELWDEVKSQLPSMLFR